MDVSNIIESLKLIKPEIAVSASLILVLIFDLIFHKDKKLIPYVALLGLFATGYFVIHQFGTTGFGFATKSTFKAFGMVTVDSFGTFFKLLILISAVLVLFFSSFSDEIKKTTDRLGEYYVLIFGMILGMFLMVSATDFLLIYLSMELLSLSSYVLAGFTKLRDRNSEASLKYVIYGSVSSGLMLFGISIIYGLTGSTNLYVINSLIQSPQINVLALSFALILVMAGMGFKISAAPFHFWTPDVYQGAANETASVIASLPKIGAVAVLIRLVSLSAPENPPLVLFMTVLACASMFYGNLIALQQTDLKRLLGFSGIAHAGYALIGFVTLDRAGYSAALYYIVGYAFMVLACFTVICHVAPDGANLSLEQLGGLHRRSPLLALTLVVGIFALAGIPPFVGFMGKFNLLVAALGRGHLWLVIIAMVNAAIGVYYYLSVVREACLREAPEQPPIVLPWSSRLLCGLLIAAIVVLGVAPGRFLDSVATSVACVNVASPTAPAVMVAGETR